MGYVAVHAAPIKVKKVILTTTVEETVHVSPKMGKRGQINIGQGTDEKRLVYKAKSLENFPKGTDFREFRAAVSTLLPYLTPGSSKSIEEMLPSDPLRPVTENTRDFFKTNHELVDALNLAFAIQSASGKKNSKATPSQFQQARNRYLHLCANIGFQDSTGKKYQHYTDIPQNIRGYFEKTFNRKITVKEPADSSNESKGDKVPPTKEAEPSDE
jgi:hypothetical protein